MRRFWLLIGLFALIAPLSMVQAATTFADPKFQTRWQAGEAITPNFWGPLPLAKDGQQEEYKEVSGGKRQVQYFDKGRMELTNGAVTNGLLATEITKGQLQTGDATFQAKPSPSVAIAGDPDNPGPTYAQLSGKGKALFDAAPKQTGNYAQAVVSSAGDISVSNAGPTPAATFAAFDDATKHNVPKAFADYRDKAGLATIGLAISEPFATTVKVGGQPKQVLVQVFERRVLTYTDTNPDAFKVEMGNIGAHYYQWRYGSTSVTQVPSATAQPTVAPSVATPTTVAEVASSSAGGVQTFSGSGTKVTPKFQLKAGLAAFRATSKSGQNNFIAELRDDQGGLVDLAANEIGPSSSSRLTAIKRDGTFVITVDYEGAWTIEVSNPGNVLDNPITAPTSISGTGTMITRPLSLPKGLLTITYTSKGKDNFIVELHDSRGAFVDLGANEIGNSSGSRAISVPADGVYIFSVEFDGQWSFNLAVG